MAPLTRACSPIRPVSSSPSSAARGSRAAASPAGSRSPGVRVVLGLPRRRRRAGRRGRCPATVSGADNAGAAAPATSSSSPCRGTATGSCSWRSRTTCAARSSSTASTRWASTGRGPTRCRSRRAAPPSRRSPCCRTAGSSRLPPRQRRAAARRVGRDARHRRLVLGDDREATDLVQALAGRIPGMRGVYGGRLRNAHQVEALTANLISVNRRYKAHAGTACHRRLTTPAPRSTSRTRRAGRLDRPVAHRGGRGDRAGAARRGDRVVLPPRRPRRRPRRRHEEPRRARASSTCGPTSSSRTPRRTARPTSTRCVPPASRCG
jgi:hypothetical protein